MKEQVRLGTARAIITPEVGCQLYGYSPDVFSTTVNDDLTATVFAFRQGEKAALLVSVTLCSIQTELCVRIREVLAEATGIPQEFCLVAATHTHSGPNLSGAAGWGDIDTGYLEKIFLPAILGAARQAVENMVPVTMGMAQGDSLVGINRRQLNADNTVSLGQNPWGCFNPKMTVLSFADESGKVVANMIHYGCHGTASGKNTEISRDWSGVMIDELENLTGAVTAFFNGPEGDVGPRLMNGRTVGAMTVHDAITHGGMAAQDAMRIYKEIRVRREFSIEAATEPLAIPLEPRISKEAAAEMYEKFKEHRVNWGAGQKAYAKRVLDSYEDGYEEKDARVIPQTIIRLGDIAFVGFPFELFSEVGMRIDGASELPYVLSLSNTNGSESYLATQDALCRGGYEINMHKMSYLQPYSDNADFEVLKGTLANLKKLGK